MCMHGKSEKCDQRYQVFSGCMYTRGNFLREAQRECSAKTILDGPPFFLPFAVSVAPR